jgi:hypothetical protein
MHGLWQVSTPLSREAASADQSSSVCAGPIQRASAWTRWPTCFFGDVIVSVPKMMRQVRGMSDAEKVRSLSALAHWS